MSVVTPHADTYRYADFGIPRSWYRVGWSSDLAAGDVKPLKYFGRDLVLYRTADGEPVLLDAYCQHLGAHLGHGGTVEERCIVCPFHGWKWTPEGVNVEIPYAPNTTPRRIAKWNLREKYGALWAWFDRDGGEPTFELPDLLELSDGTYDPCGQDARMTWPNVGVHPLQPAENTADPAHIRFIHGAGAIPGVDGFEEDGAVFRTYLRYLWGAGRERTSLTPDGPTEGVLNANCHGLGLIVTTYTGIWPTVQLTGCTPIDSERSDYYTMLQMKPGIEESVYRSILKHFMVTVEADFPVWENMVWIEHPPLPRLEAKVMRQIRRWSRQFGAGAMVFDDESSPNGDAFEDHDDIREVAGVAE